MKLYYDPISTTSRPIMMLVTEHDLNIDFEIVDLFAGEHLSDRFTALNPNQLVPVLEDGDFRLTESSAILKYLADSAQLPVYPQDLKGRARVNEAMDWFNSNFYRDFGYGIVYPQTMPHYRRANPVVQDAVVRWGNEKSLKWLRILNDRMIGDDGVWLCGPSITIADYLGISIITLGEWVDYDLSAYPNVERWIGTMKARPAWKTVNAAFYGLVSAIQAQNRETA